MYEFYSFDLILKINTPIRVKVSKEILPEFMEMDSISEYYEKIEFVDNKLIPRQI